MNPRTCERCEEMMLLDDCEHCHNIQSVCEACRICFFCGHFQ